MKCLVCGKEYEAAECPRCHFPDIQIVGDRKAFLESLMPTVHTYRKNFLSSIQVELVAHYWKEQGGKLVPDRRERLLLETADVLQRHEVWLPNRFARIPNQKEISVTVCIRIAGEERLVQVSVPNLQKAALQKLGASVDADFRLRIKLGNDIENPTVSKPVPLFPE